MEKEEKNKENVIETIQSIKCKSIELMNEG